MPYRDVLEFASKLREQGTLAFRALEFLILTAARSGEVLGARRDEIDFDAAVWTVPSKRMKSGPVHRVPLSPRAIEILNEIQNRGQDRPEHDALIFPGRRGRVLDSRKLQPLVPGATVHGFRSSFRDWCGEETNFAREICEAALAHKTGNSVELSYRRGDALEKRRGLMEAWAAYCESDSGGNVIPIRTAL
jgi:integrase